MGTVLEGGIEWAGAKSHHPTALDGIVLDHWRQSGDGGRKQSEQRLLGCDVNRIQ